MARNISFFLTTPQFLAGTKDVTRRLGWSFLKAGDELMAIEKGQGLKKGETVVQLGLIKIVGVSTERLDQMIRFPAYGIDECRREGFPEMTPHEFVEFFCKSHKGCYPKKLITRIEFKRI